MQRSLNSLLFILSDAKQKLITADGCNSIGASQDSFNLLQLANSSIQQAKNLWERKTPSVGPDNSSGALVMEIGHELSQIEQTTLQNAQDTIKRIDNILSILHQINLHD